MQLTIDNKLRLLTGKPIIIDNFGEVKPLTLSQIIDIGYINYLHYVKIFTFKKEQFMENPPEELTVFDFLMMAEDPLVEKMMKEALEVILQEQITIVKEKMIIAVGSTSEDLRFITRLNYDDLCHVIQLQNYFKSVENNTEISVSNSKAKEIQEKLKRTREEVKRIKSRENDDSTDLFDIISAISVKGNISKDELLNYTIFEIYDKYKRLIHIDQYETGISAMMQGAKNVKLKHWSTKINS